ncbi:MAG TPA: exodeoxyribonuclease VII small subunit [Candidatus Saccharimonadales bacterium]|nr:exodeoxyribonuclease VII small subunit [Candidatus Saccharimonadales bacterium]
MSVKSKSIQEKTAELSEMIAWFDSDEFTLEASIDKFKEAEKLAADIEKDLLSLKNDIQVVKQKFDSVD